MQKKNKERVEHFASLLKALGRSERTIRAYCSDLNIVFGIVDEISTDSMKNVVVQLSDRGLKKSSITRLISAVNLFCTLNDIEFNPKVLVLPSKCERIREALTLEEFKQGIDRILSDYSKSRYPRWFIRDIFMILYYTGLRVSELLELRSNSYNTAKKTLRVIGKGNKERSIPVPDTLSDILLNSDFYTLLPKVKYITVVYWTKKYFGNRFSPHSFRHSYITTIINGGVDEYSVKAVAGHSSYLTTLRYFHVSDDEVGQKIRNVFADL